VHCVHDKICKFFLPLSVITQVINPLNGSWRNHLLSNKVGQNSCPLILDNNHSKFSVTCVRFVYKYLALCYKFSFFNPTPFVFFKDISCLIWDKGKSINIPFVITYVCVLDIDLPLCLANLLRSQRQTWSNTDSASNITVESVQTAVLHLIWVGEKCISNKQWKIKLLQIVLSCFNPVQVGTRLFHNALTTRLRCQSTLWANHCNRS